MLFCSRIFLCVVSRNLLFFVRVRVCGLMSCILCISPVRHFLVSLDVAAGHVRVLDKLNDS